MKYNIGAMLVLVVLTGCGNSRNDEWSGIDYSRIAHDNYMRENDQNYRGPNVIGCVDDDLYNCNPRTPTYR